MTFIRKITLYSLGMGLLFWWLPFSLSGQGTKEVEKDFLLSHVGDSYSCHFGAVHLFLPVIVYRKGRGFSFFSSSHLGHGDGHGGVYDGLKLEGNGMVSVDGERVYDFSITKNVFFMWLSLLLLLLLFIGTAGVYRRRRGLIYGGWVLPVYLIRFVRDEIAKPNIGERHYRGFMPYLLTIFFYVLLNNLLGLWPGGGNVTGNISIVLVLALGTLGLTCWNGSAHYWGHIFNPPDVPKWILPILVPLEVLGIFTKPFTLMLRLFINMLAGHLLLTAVIGLIFMLNNLFMAIIAVPFGAFILLIKLFVSFVQAYVFTLLTSMAFGAAVEEH